MPPMIPCSACDRFVSTTDSECPFCGASVPRTSIAKRVIRGSRAAVFAAAVGAAGCTEAAADTDGGVTEDAAVDAAVDAETELDGGPGADAEAADGGSPIDAGADAGEDASADAGSDIPAYGAPPVDSGIGEEDAGVDSGFGALYGGAPVDAGSE